MVTDVKQQLAKRVDQCTQKYRSRCEAARPTTLIKSKSFKAQRPSADLANDYWLVQPSKAKKKKKPAQPTITHPCYCLVTVSIPSEDGLGTVLSDPLFEEPALALVELRSLRRLGFSLVQPH